MTQRGDRPLSEQQITTWLLDGDPSVAWQTQRDLLDQPESVWVSTRAQVETQGWGAELLAQQDEDGQWASSAFWPSDFTEERWMAEGQPWTSTNHVLEQLYQFGLDPHSERARRTVELVGENCRWEEGGQLYWDGEVEECINGRTLAHGSWFGAPIEPILQRLLADVQPDGGWNCERANGSQVSSFQSTLLVLGGLLSHELAHPGRAEVRAARERGEEYLLQRHLFRSLSRGDIADENMLTLTQPPHSSYTVLRALDHFRKAGVALGTPPDPRLAEAIELIESRRLDDGRWPTDGRPRGAVWIETDGAPGDPSPWNTLVALRVLRWWDARSVETLA